MNHETLMAQGPVECRVRLCRDCKHHMPEPNSEWNLRCMHPTVNASDPWALAGSKPHGSCAHDEREKTWTLRGLAPCGMRGALWEPNAPHEGRTAASSPGVPLDAVVGRQNVTTE